MQGCPGPQFVTGRPRAEQNRSSARRFRRFGMLAFCAILAGGCAENKKSPGEKQSTPLRLAWSYWPGYSPLLIAEDRGLFRQRGLDVKLVQYDVSSKQMPDFEAGIIDAGLFAYADALTLAARRRDAYGLILVCDNSAGADVIVARPEIKTIGDLAGKRIGVGIGSFGELLARRMLARSGLSPKDVQLVNMSAEKVPNALGRVIDAGQTWDPFATEAVTRGNHRLFSSAETPGLIPDVLLVRKEIVKTRQPELQRLLQAWFEAVDFIRNQPDQARTIIARMTDKPLESINLAGVRILDARENNDAFHRADSPLSLEDSARVNIEFMLTTGALAEEPRLDQFLDGSLITSVLASREQ